MNHEDLLETIPYLHYDDKGTADIEKFSKAIKSEIVMIRKNKTARLFFGFNFPNDTEICFSPSMQDLLITPDLSCEEKLKDSIYSYEEGLKKEFETFFILMTIIFGVSFNYSNEQLNEFIDNLLYGTFAKFKKIYF